MDFFKERGLKCKIYNKTPLEVLEMQKDISAHIIFMNYNDMDDNVAYHIHRILKPGGLCFIESNTKNIFNSVKDLYRYGMTIKDMCAWIRPDIQSTSFGMKYIIEHSKDLTDEEKKCTLEQFKGLRTVKLRNCIQPIIICQKNIEPMRNLVYNQKKHQTGLMNTTHNSFGNLSSNVMTTEFIDGYDIPFLIPRVKTKKCDFQNEFYEDGLLRIYYHLLKTFSHENNKIIDLNTQKGSIMCACMLLGNLNYIGNEYDKEKFNMYQKRTKEFIEYIPPFNEKYLLVF